MKYRRSLALTAVICMAMAGACHDAPLGPRAPTRHAATLATRLPRVQAFSGPAADSVMQLIEPTWLRLDRSQSAFTRLDWRLRNHVPARINPVEALPNDVLTSGSTAPVPQILSHYEHFYFGSHYQTSSTPSGVEGEMTFVGDIGEIKISSLTITPDSGAAPFVTSGGGIAYGVGSIINCADVTSGTCYQRHLNGVRLISNAPDCNAHASGTVGYSASISQSTFNSTWGTSATGTGQSVSASAPISATAPACSSTTGGQTTDSTSTAGTGTVGPAPAPTGPNVPSAPPPPTPTSGAGGGFVCDRTDFYQIIGTTQTLLSTTIDCYPE